MSHSEPTTKKPVMYSLHDMTVMLIKHLDLHEGLYDLSFEFQIAVGGVGPSPESICPGAMIGIRGVGLSSTPLEQLSVNTVNAAKVNPLKQPRKKKAQPAQ